jgi:hypothetical protein
MRIIVEGNCGELGFTEYNLGLGHKRATEVKAVLLKAAVDCGRVSTSLQMCKIVDRMISNADRQFFPGHAARSRSTFVLLFSLLLCILLALNSTAVAIAAPQTDPDALFNEAVDAYNHNLFTQAQSKFQQVSGAHAQEAQQYLGKMKAYRDAIDVAKSAIDRPADEQDANNLAFAMQQLQVALKIKADGPWNPADLLERARTLKAQVEKARADTSKNMDRDFCAKALSAIAQQHYKQAEQYICLVANDNPGYSCGDDEAVHMCQVNTDLAKTDLAKTGLAKMDKGGVPAPTPVPKSEQPSSVTSSAFDRAKAAYDKNDFEHARVLFKGVDANSKPDADQYLDKISRYTAAIAGGEKLSRDSQYDQARTAFLAAAAIKPDGPGDPQNRASAMELFVGLDHFYSGDYASAIQHLQNCARTGTQKQPLVHFYLGASELAKYFVTGSEDASLREDALNDLKQAKQAGFKATGQELSPKILQVYKDLSF